MGEMLKEFCKNIDQSWICAGTSEFSLHGQYLLRSAEEKQKWEFAAIIGHFALGGGTRRSSDNVFF